jgi:hypothetical protein
LTERTVHLDLKENVENLPQFHGIRSNQRRERKVFVDFLDVMDLKETLDFVDILVFLE